MIHANQIKPGLKFQVENSNIYIIKHISDNQMVYIIDIRHEITTIYKEFEFLRVDTVVELINHNPLKWKVLNLSNKLEYIEEL
tara:strand:- start:5965 stop:6213 length:249 start_codon:yes stop_codon:yes gene_type:complete